MEIVKRRSLFKYKVLSNYKINYKVLEDFTNIRHFIRYLYYKIIERNKTEISIPKQNVFDKSVCQPRFATLQLTR